MHKKIITALLALSLAASNCGFAITSFADEPADRVTEVIQVKQQELKIKGLIPTAEEKTIKDVKTYGKFQYVIENDDTVTIVGCDEDTTWIKLTKNLNGRLIKKIDNNAFKNHTKLTKVTLSDGLEEIGAKAFYNTGVTEITIPATVKYIRRSAFSNCVDLKSVYANSYKNKSIKLGEGIFKENKLTIYCAKNSQYMKYAQTNKIDYLINAKLENEKPVQKEETEDSENTESVTNSNVRIKYIKGCPEGLEDTSYSWHEEGDEYVFDRSGMRITKSDYIILCNCTANEYGANWVPEWEMALVCEVVYNLYHIEGRESLYNCITVPQRFSGSWAYKDLDHFSSKVNDRVINAVNIYLSFPEYFNEGYTQFRGDGTWNWFW